MSDMTYSALREFAEARRQARNEYVRICGNFLNELFEQFQKLRQFPEGTVRFFRSDSPNSTVLKPSQALDYGDSDGLIRTNFLWLLDQYQIRISIQIEALAETEDYRFRIHIEDEGHALLNKPGDIYAAKFFDNFVHLIKAKIADASHTAFIGI